MKPSKITVVVLTLLALLTTQATAIIQDMPDKGNILTEVSFPKDEGYILLPVTLFGEKYYFLLHTGLRDTVYDFVLKPFLGPVVRRVKIGSKYKLFYDSPAAKLGSLSLKTKEPVSVADLRVISNYIGRRVHGVIGLSFLKKYAFKIDFDKSKVVFYKSLYKNYVKNWVSKSCIYYKNLPVINALISGKSLPFIIDTGFNGNGYFHRGLMNYLVKMNKMKLVINQTGFLDSFSFGSFMHSKVMFSLGKFSTIGLGLISRYIFIFDFPNNIIYLRKRTQNIMQQRLGKTGIFLIRKKKHTIIHSVSKNSLASKFGFRKGDLIVSVDGKKSSDFTLFSLRRYLRKTGKKIKLKISRKGEIMKLQLKPEAY